ncbi:E3 ubiquitin-protein ligase DCST1 [Merluccius polli]|uniref:E3 ubiquitin-protein ligase DCST1 n=1 Tax=Merluccius polli TaxID=89951 RepID=A0AA47MT13_MERPO|nr:E3 ubiquitin-protein ligase DCST1 [Merluccius polli]
MEQTVVKTPHSTLEQIALLLPAAVYHLLFSQSEGLPMARILLRAVFGAVIGAGLFLGLIYNLPMTLQPKLAVGFFFIALCVLGAVFSSSFRASSLLIFPSMLGSRGRNYLLVFTLSALFSGPLSNIQRNVQSVALSLGCNLDLQMNHSRLLWRSTVEPLISISQQVMEEKVGFQEEALNISRAFQQIRDEVIAQYSYGRFHTNSSTNSTQDQFTIKTQLQCDNVVEQGIERCQEWFQVKWQKCIENIAVPIIGDILCVSMKFHFLCDVMRAMTPWCRQEIPVEGNFGQTFDKLNQSIDLLSREFSTDLVLEHEEQQVLLGDFQDRFVAELTSSFQEAQDLSSHVLETLQILLSLTFITIFTGAFGYVRQYRNDIFFDNTYITTYFRQIDARRKTAKKHYLLPLNRTERIELINPWSPLIHPSELQELVMCLGVLVFVLLAVDLTLSHMLDILHTHTLTEFNLTSHHHVDIRVGGASIMARLLRKTISAFNSSSRLHAYSSNQDCMPQSTALPAVDYFCSTAPVLLMAVMCCLQVYSNRLRRAIAAFYYPKWDKRRVLFLYNVHIQNRLRFIAHHRTQLAIKGLPHTQAQGLPRCVQVVLERLGCRLPCCRLSRCCVCGTRGCGGQGSGVGCPSLGCEAVFCPPCWDHLDHQCPCRHHENQQHLDPAVAHDYDCHGA